jgi:hypothetical protein
MTMHRPLVFDPERSALLSIMVERACHEALKRGLTFPPKVQDVRTMFAGRMIRAIEAGETDPQKLQILALGDDRKQAMFSQEYSNDDDQRRH